MYFSWMQNYTCATGFATLKATLLSDTRTHKWWDICIVLKNVSFLYSFRLVEICYFCYISKAFLKSNNVSNQHEMKIYFNTCSWSYCAWFIHIFSMKKKKFFVIFCPHLIILPLKCLSFLSDITYVGIQIFGYILCNDIFQKPWQYLTQ